MIKKLSKLQKTLDKKEMDLIRDIVKTLGQQVRLTKQVMETMKKTQGLMSNILDNEKIGADNTDRLIKSINDVVKIVKELKLSERVIWTMFRLMLGLILLLAFWNPLTKLVIFFVVLYKFLFIRIYGPLQFSQFGREVAMAILCAWRSYFKYCFLFNIKKNV